MPRKKILLLGGAGFVGSWLARALLPENDVYVFDLLEPIALRRAYAPATTETILAFRNRLRAGATHYTGDVRDARAVAALFAAVRPDAVVCLSSIPIEGFPDKRTQIETEVCGALNMLAANAEIGARIVFISSFIALGNFGEPAAEDRPLSPTTAYGMGKATAESLIPLFGTSSYAIIRPSVVYGFGEAHGRATTLFIEQCLSGGSCSVNASASADLIYVKDLVAAIVKAVEWKENGVLNVSSGLLVPLARFAEEAEIAIGMPLRRETDDANDRPLRAALVNAKVRQCLSWEPRYSLYEGIKEIAGLYHEAGLYR